jgi:peptidoglycan-associated lipoprotein
MKITHTTVLLLLALLAACSTPQTREEGASSANPSSSASSTSGSAQPGNAPSARGGPGRGINDPKSVLSQRTVFYALDEYALNPEYRPLVEAHAKYLRDTPNASVSIEGNCDERGSREYNLALGQRRADAIKNVMLLLGVQERQIETVSFGEEKPQADGHDEPAYSKNRRSDIVYKRMQ